MGNFKLAIGGCPPALNAVKLRPLLESRIGNKGVIDKIEKREDGVVVLQFKTGDDLAAFRNSNVTEIPFGKEIHVLTVLNEEVDSAQTRISQDDQRDNEAWRKKLYVRNIPNHLYAYKEFRCHFERFGPLEKCFMKDDKSFAYVTFFNHLDAVAARFGAVPAGPFHSLVIQWADKEDKPVERPSAYPRPLMSIPVNRPSSGQEGLQRQWVSTSNLSQCERPSTAPRRQQSVAQGLNRLDESAYKNVHYWSSFNQLPAKEGTLCVLAQDIDDSTHLQTVQMHFESKKRSNGGLVRDIVRMIDGLLVIFQDPKDCSSCVEMKDQKFNEKRIQIFGKKIPTFFERKFVIEGVGSKTKADTLTMFLESCSSKESSPTSCKLQSNPGVYLIEYADDFDPAEAVDILRNAQSQRLENSQLKASRLLRTDCLKVSGVEGNVTSDTIRLKFESKKRTNGGPVTRVDRVKNKAALVYFADFADAERVYEKFKKPCDEELLFNERPVEVDLYFHSFACDHENVSNRKRPNKKSEGVEGASTANCNDTAEEPKRSLRSFNLPLEYDDKILFFIMNNKVHDDKLTNAFKGLATMEISIEKRGKKQFLIKLIPDESISAQSQKVFNNKCQKRFEDFLSDFSSVSTTFEQSKLEKARSSNLSPFLDKSYKGDDASIAVIWKHCTVDVTGLKTSVDKFVDEVKAVLDYSEKKMEISVNQFRLMHACGIVEELQQNHLNVIIRCNDKSQSITLTGPDSDTYSVQLNALTMLHTVEKKRLIGLDELVHAFLAENMKNSSAIKLKIQDKFTSDGVKAALSSDSDDVYINTRSKSEYQKAVTAIKQLIGLETIHVDEASSATVSSPQWKGFVQSLTEQEPSRVYVKQNRELVVVGLRSDLRSICNKIRCFLNENATRRYTMQMPYGNAKFITEKAPEFSKDACRRKKINCGLTSEGGGGVYLEGKKVPLDAAYAEMLNLVQMIAEGQQTFHEPGIKQYFDGGEGKDFLDMMERANNCTILVMTKSCRQWEAEAQGNELSFQRTAPNFSMQNPQEQLYISVKLPNSRVSVQVWKASIIEHQCDVIVNASNTEFQLLSGGVSGAIKAIDSRNGNLIQKAMDKLVKENYGDFLPGDAPLTTAGGLNNCKRIVHAIGPRWNSSSDRDASRVLQSCIRKSLEETDRAKMASIAIPAVSCGVFGGKAHVCIPLILETIVDYFKEKTNTSIRRIDFIENQREDVLTEFKKSVQKYRSSSSISENQQQPTPIPRPQPQSFSNNPSMRTTSSSVKLLIADISNVQADVIVNITDAKGFPSMDGSSISRALKKKAGAAIQAECARTPGPHNIGSVFRTNGGRLQCKELCHGIVSPYNSRSKSIVKHIVATCLTVAESAGYSSIAFPAIATGGFRYPAAKVARWMREEISKFQAANLKTIIIVLYPQDVLAIGIFQSEFNGARQTSQPSQNVSGASFQASSQSFGIVSINVYQGDITQEKSDAIVNSTNSNFDLSQGMVSKEIIRRGGKQIQVEAQNGSGSDYRMTSGGNLPCQSIFHIVTPSNERDISQKVKMVLDAADQQGIRSISFPALGTGNLGLTSLSIAFTMRKTFEAFGKSGVSSLKTVNVVIFDRSMITDFQKGLLGTEQSFFGKVKETFNSFFGGSSVSNWNMSDSKLDLYFYSTSQDAIKNAIDAIQKETKKVVHSQVLHDETFGRFSEWEFREINEIAVANNVKITDKSDKYLKRLLIEGMMRGVMKAQEGIKDILKEFCEAETTATFVTWQKNVHGAWENYKPRSANVLEKAFKARNGNNTDPKLNRITVPEYENQQLKQTVVDLTNIEGGQNGQHQPTVRRKVNERVETDVLPSFWAAMNGQPYITVPLQPGSKEYQTAYDLFVKSAGNWQIHKIERVQNESLYKQYIAKKAEVGKNMTTKNPVERKLFHGTAVADKIMLHGFDRSYAGLNASHGRGVYFAVKANYSCGDHYSPRDHNGHKRVFVADVITGDFCQGNSSLVAPPTRSSGVQNDLFDSVVDNTRQPNMFIIFKDASAYPTFLITFG